MSVAGVPSHQQHLSCPRHERSLYRMSKRSRPPTSQRGKGSSIPAVPGIGHEEASRATVAQRGPIKGRGITPSARSCPLYALTLHCCGFRSYRSIGVGCRPWRPAERTARPDGTKGELKVAACMVTKPCGPRRPRKWRIRVWVPLGGVSVTSAGLRSVSRETAAPLVAGKPHHWKWLATSGQMGQNR